MSFLSNMDNVDDMTKEEEKHLNEILQIFQTYRTFSRQFVYKRLSYLESLPQVQQIAMKKYKYKLEQVLKCIDQNAQIIQLIIKDVEKLYQNVHLDMTFQKRIRFADIEKVQITLKQFYREWSSEGREERRLCYDPILEAIDEIYPHESCQREKIKVLVPGAGLGRLAFEITKQGFTCQGNEFSLYMLLASNFILNKTDKVDMFELHPWAHQAENNMKPEDQLVKINFPDVDPSELFRLYGTSRFSMVAGDFLEVYTKNNSWDCIATCFFIDCAINIYEFIERIFTLLKKGGTWINLGPLQYHFSTTPSCHSIEPSFEVVKNIIRSIGFNIKTEKTGLRTTYSQNPRSMHKQFYESVFLICTKPLNK